MNLVLFLTLVALASANNIIVQELNLEVPANDAELARRIDAHLTSSSGRSSRLNGGSSVQDEKTWNFVTELTSVLTSRIFTCTGSLIKEDFALSARNCVM